MARRKYVVHEYEPERQRESLSRIRIRAKQLRQQQSTFTCAKVSKTDILQIIINRQYSCVLLADNLIIE